ncbi:hypothetical protein AVEN_180187-1 [Araneus ventricosus]|uniref:Uncharacterized protein n=1 Tax=Araneus ventricosus TaxID=182803 RepID=A0A4Y2UP92_ARAVE|nr:hypothetical protein AVEN_180187-1 [Araneus ventricosus]
MTRTTSELPSPLQLPHHTSNRTFDPQCQISREPGSHNSESSVESGSEPGAFRFRSRDLNTKPAQTAYYSHEKNPEQNCLK